MNIWRPLVAIPAYNITGRRGLPVTVIPGNNVAALVAVAASNKLQAASNSLAAMTVWAFTRLD
jgi:hypothetical protein